MPEDPEKRRVVDWWIVVSGAFAFVTALSWGAADARIGDRDFSWPMSPILWLSLLIVAAGVLSLVRAARPPWWLYANAALLAAAHAFVLVSYALDKTDRLLFDPIVTLFALIVVIVFAARLRPLPDPDATPRVRADLSDPEDRRVKRR